ncbi:MAG: hypothetical protein ACE366_02495 [Bradymonadia bacterium]
MLRLSRTIGLTMVVSGTLLSGCDVLSSLSSMEGRITDADGNPVQGATVRTYGFLDNLEYLRFGSPPADELDPQGYRVRVDIASLDGEDGRGDRVSGTAVTDADGRYVIDGMPLDGIIAVASLPKGSKDIKGMDRSDGTVSLSSALSPDVERDRDNLTESGAKFRANFVLQPPPAEDTPEGPSSDVTPAPEPDNPIELVPPVAPEGWSEFVIEDLEGNVLVDASADNGLVDGTLPIVTAGGNVRIRGRYGDTSVRHAVLRVQQGGGPCDDSDPARVREVPLMLADGVITSHEGDFQLWSLSGGFEKFQLDADDTPGDETDSYVVTVEAPCAVRAAPLTVTLMWNQPNVDVDLYIWDVGSGIQTYHGSYSNGERGRSNYGYMSIIDNQGGGPEAFTLNPGETGGYLARAHVFCGPPDDVALKARVVWWQGGQWHDEIFDATMSTREDWVDIGRFHVDPL